MAANKKMSKSVVVSDKVKDYGNDPFFVKKAKDSKVFLEKHGFPKQMISGLSQKAKAKAKI
jgi:hypothetical protein